MPPRSPVQQGQNSENENRETPCRRGRKKVKANKAKVYRDLLAIQKKLQVAQKKMEKYKKRCTRLSGQLSKLDSPKQKTKKQMKLQPKSLKKTLLFHNVVLSELKKKNTNKLE